jgi:anti-sigma regulatory factor (Ser/Thr protein kinase)
MNTNLPKEASSTDKLFAFIGQFVAVESVDEQTAFHLTVAAEELFTNLVKYSTRSHKPVNVRLERTGEWLEMQIIDSDADAFDITTAQLPDLDVPIIQRRAGGMGLHLVRSFADELSYRHKDGNSVITFRKKMEGPHVRGSA